MGKKQKPVLDWEPLLKTGDPWATPELVEDDEQPSGEDIRSAQEALHRQVYGVPEEAIATVDAIREARADPIEREFFSPEETASNLANLARSDALAMGESIIDRATASDFEAGRKQNARIEKAWNEFQRLYPDHAQDQAAVAKAASIVAQRAGQPVSALLKGKQARAEFLEAVADELKYAAYEQEPEHRTVSYGSDRPSQVRPADDEAGSDFIDDFTQMQKRSGFF